MTQTGDPIIRLERLEKAFVKGRETIRPFHDLDLEVARGAFLAIMGPSGSGKTTLLNIMAGIERPSSGQATVAGARIDSMSERALAAWRSRNIGFIFQFYNLMPMLSAARNVELPLLLTSHNRAERRRRVETALEIVGLSDRKSHRPTELSGGQQQRVAIARAIVSDPPLLFADEPTGDLDRETAVSILEMLQLLKRELGKTIVMVTHDPAAARYADKAVSLEKGQFTAMEFAA
jgi:putative ABC transport system ATP-binding protein